MKNLIARFLPLALPALAALFFAGCADTVIKKTWTAPAVGSIKFTKVFIIALTPDDMNRRLAEIAVKAQVTKIEAVGAYQFLPDISDTKDKAKVLQAIKTSGADGLITLRLLYTDTNVTYGGSNALPMEYQTFSSYYGTTYDLSAFYASDTRNIYADRIFGIETNIYDAKTLKLIWSGQTHSTKDLLNGSDVEGLLTDVAEVVKSRLKSQELIP